MEKAIINQKETQKGITLIALVITIIVLLILAGVSIAMLTGQNGILTQAQNAKTTTENKSAEEKVKLAVMGARKIKNRISKLWRNSRRKYISSNSNSRWKKFHSR